ncbi:MAG: hypothetical protein HYX68_04105 [Planctomycetes bacterium]|nr:hypothetical protein [Planctomycetota bacterium]
MDRRKLALLEAIKIAAQEGGEVRLYRRGKLPGLFAQRTRLNAEIANQAIQDGLLEIVRVETIGKTAVEWVHVTPKGLDLLLDSESPVRALENLRETLALNQSGLPAWASEWSSRISELARTIEVEVTTMRQQLERLSQRVSAALDRLEAARPKTPAPPEVPWARETLDFLERRETVGLGPRCPLADLFATLREKHGDLSIKDFHAGLKRLLDNQAIRLHPSAGVGDAPGPECALLDGAAIYYYVERVRPS